MRDIEGAPQYQAAHSTAVSVTMRGVGVESWDWKTIGAIAGPTLALVSLAWQAREKWRRPFVVVEYAANTGDRPEDENWGASVVAFVRVVNPKPVPLLVQRVEMHVRPARRHWWSLPGRATTDEVKRCMTLVAGYGQEQWQVTAGARYEPVDVRVVVRRGRHGWRRIRAPWQPEAAHVTSTRERVEAQLRQR